MAEGGTSDIGTIPQTAQPSPAGLASQQPNLLDNGLRLAECLGSLTLEHGEAADDAVGPGAVQSGSDCEYDDASRYDWDSVLDGRGELDLDADDVY